MEMVCSWLESNIDRAAHRQPLHPLIHHMSFTSELLTSHYCKVIGALGLERYCVAL
jgi:hypothetical protein